MTRFKALSATLSVFLALTSVGHTAEKALLDVLLQNGAITAEQHTALLKKETLDKGDVDEIIVTLDKKGFRAKSADGNYAIKVGARLHAQAAFHGGDIDAAAAPIDGTELRRARIEMSGQIARDFKWAAEADLADNKVSLKDFWLGYTARNGTHIYFGNQKQPYSLSLEMSSNDLPFIERPISGALTAPFVDRAIGVRVQQSGDNWFAAGGIFGESVAPDASENNEGWGIAGRFVYTPVLEDDRVVHLGVRSALRKTARADRTARIRDETTHFSSLRVVDTGTLDDARQVEIHGLEAGVAVGPFAAVGEYNTLGLERTNAADVDFDSWSVHATWSLTGESLASTYSMKSGEFKRLAPARNFSREDGTWGAWEVALRLAEINLNDGDVTGGEESVLTSALNWYLNNNLRLMFEWSRVIDTDGSSLLRQQADGLDIYQFRAQFIF